MKVLKNKTTGEEIYANGVDFTRNEVRLNKELNGDILRPAPALWTDYSTAIATINDAETLRLSQTDEFKTDWELIDK